MATRDPARICRACTHAPSSHRWHQCRGCTVGDDVLDVGWSADPAKAHRLTLDQATDALLACEAYARRRTPGYVDIYDLVDVIEL